MRLQRRVLHQALEHRLGLGHARTIVAFRRPDGAQIGDECVEHRQMFVGHDGFHIRVAYFYPASHTPGNLISFVQRLAFDRAAAQ